MSSRLRRNVVAIHRATLPAVALCGLWMTSAAHAQTLAAAYLFNNTLTAQGGGSTLSLLNPLGTPPSTTGFQTMNVTYNGVDNGNRTVLHLDGNPASGQNAGLQLNVSSLITDKTSYSFETVFEFTDAARVGAYRKVLDVSNLGSDTGFYVNPSNQLMVYNDVSGGATFNNATFYHVVLTQSGGVVTGYLNGAQAFTANTSTMAINSSNVLSFFLDDNATGNGEYSDSDVAMIRLYNGALSSSQVAALAGSTIPNVSTSAPEPGSLALLLAPLAAFGTVAVRRRRSAV